MAFEAYVGIWEGGGHTGWYVEWYHQERDQICYWYGSHRDCSERAAESSPRGDETDWVGVSNAE